MERGKDLILVCGATGQQGGATANALLDAGHRVRIMTRRPEQEKAKALGKRGAEVVQADLDDEASLRRALAGAWGTFAMQNTWEAGVEREEAQGKRYARVAKEVGVKHYVYTSVGSAHRNTGIPHFDNKYRVEQTVKEQAFDSHVILRPVFFMDNLTSPNFKPALDEGKFAIGIRPDTRLQMIAVQDIGRCALQAFERHDELNGRAIDLAGDELTGPEAARILSDVTGRDITFARVPIEAIREFSDDYAIMLEWFDAVGYSADIEANTKEFGFRPMGFREWSARAF